jgi:hypothetical protein
MTGTVDHLVYAAADLDHAVAQIAGQLGVRPAYGGQHPGLGTHNALLSLGARTYLEIIAPDPARAAGGATLPFGLDDLTGPALRGWAAAPADLDAALERSLRSGFDYGTVVAGQRRTAEGAELHWRMTADAAHSALSAEPFLIDWGESPHPAESAPGGVMLAEFRLSSPDPGRLTAQLTALGVQVAVGPGPRPALHAALSGPDGQVLVLTS